MWKAAQVLFNGEPDFMVLSLHCVLRLCCLCGLDVVDSAGSPPVICRQDVLLLYIYCTIYCACAYDENGEDVGLCSNGEEWKSVWQVLCGNQQIERDGVLWTASEIVSIQLK